MLLLRSTWMSAVPVVPKEMINENHLPTQSSGNDVFGERRTGLRCPCCALDTVDYILLSGMLPGLLDLFI